MKAISKLPMIFFCILFCFFTAFPQTNVIYDALNTLYNQKTAETLDDLSSLFTTVLSRDLLSSDERTAITTYQTIVNQQRASLIVPYDTSTPPGGSSFIVLGKATNTNIQNLTFNAAWKLPTIGKGIVTFKVNTQQSAWIVLSPKAAYEKDKSIGVCIGGYGNAVSFFRTNIVDGDDLAYCIDTIQQGQEGNSATWDSYWIEVQDGKISYGKGSTPGQNKLMELTNQSIIPSLLYVGFGCYQNIKAEFANITFATITAPSVTTTPTTTTPDTTTTTPSTTIPDTTTPTTAASITPVLTSEQILITEINEAITKPYAQKFAALSAIQQKSTGKTFSNDVNTAFAQAITTLYNARASLTSAKLDKLRIFFKSIMQSSLLNKDQRNIIKTKYIPALMQTKPKSSAGYQATVTHEKASKKPVAQKKYLKKEALIK